MADDTRECPRCAETIKAKALVCRFCGQELQEGGAAAQTSTPPPAPPAPESVFEPEEPDKPRKSAGRKFLGLLGYLLLVAAATALGWYLEKEGYVLWAYNRLTGFRYAAEIVYADGLTPVPLREGRVPYRASVRGNAPARKGGVRYDHQRGNVPPRDPRTAGHAAGRGFVSIDAVKAAATADPGNPNNEFNLGTAYLLLGRYEEAVSHLERAVVLLPADDQAHANLAAAYLARGMADRAGEAALSALQFNKDRALAQNVLALAALKRKDDADALKMLQAGAGDHPDDADFQVNLGNLYREQGKAGMARRRYEKAAAADGANGAAALNLGNMTYENGRYRDALKHWKRALDGVGVLAPDGIERLKRNIAVAERKAK